MHSGTWFTTSSTDWIGGICFINKMEADLNTSLQSIVEDYFSFKLPSAASNEESSALAPFLMTKVNRKSHFEVGSMFLI